MPQVYNIQSRRPDAANTLASFNGIISDMRKDTEARNKLAADRANAIKAVMDRQSGRMNKQAVRVNASTGVVQELEGSTPMSDAMQVGKKDLTRKASLTSTAPQKILDNQADVLKVRDAAIATLKGEQADQAANANNFLANGNLNTGVNPQLNGNPDPNAAAGGATGGGTNGSGMISSGSSESASQSRSRAAGTTQSMSLPGAQWQQTYRNEDDTQVGFTDTAQTDLNDLYANQQMAAAIGIGNGENGRTPFDAEIQQRVKDYDAFQKAVMASGPKANYMNVDGRVDGGNVSTSVNRSASDSASKQKSENERTGGAGGMSTGTHAIYTTDADGNQVRMDGSGFNEKGQPVLFGYEDGGGGSKTPVRRPVLNATKTYGKYNNPQDLLKSESFKNSMSNLHQELQVISPEIANAIKEADDRGLWSRAVDGIAHAFTGGAVAGEGAQYAGLAQIGMTMKKFMPTRLYKDNDPRKGLNKEDFDFEYVKDAATNAIVALEVYPKGAPRDIDNLNYELSLEEGRVRELNPVPESIGSYNARTGNNAAARKIATGTSNLSITGSEGAKMKRPKTES